MSRYASGKPSPWHMPIYRVMSLAHFVTKMHRLVETRGRRAVVRRGGFQFRPCRMMPVASDHDARPRYAGAGAVALTRGHRLMTSDYDRLLSPR